MNAKYTPAQIAWLIINRPLNTIKELTPLFNRAFATEMKETSIKSACKNRKIVSGKDTRFKPGHNTHNKGVPSRLSMATEFKKGNLPIFTNDVGTEKWRGDGYLWVKIAMPKTWRQKHVMLYESVHGPVNSKTHNVIFKDGNRKNITPENLVAVTHAELLRLSQNKYLSQPDELKPTVFALSKLQTSLFAKSKAIDCHPE